MKKITLLFYLLISFNLVLPNPIDTETAKLVAKHFMERKRNSSNNILNIVVEKLNDKTSFYVINFSDDGWVMVSSDNSTIPVLGYSIEGFYKIEDEKPDAFIDWINGYKKEILSASELNIPNIIALEKWDDLLNSKQPESIKTYTPGTALLDVPGRGHIQWSQDYNNDGGCTPSYHKYCPTGSGSDCRCGRNSVGCGAVAMGQIMWYWQWPHTSSFRTYNWNLMPAELTNNSEIFEEDEIAHLLRDIGEPSAADMTYWCSGTWTTFNKIEDAFKNMFNYKGVKKFVRENWNYGNAWEDLLRSEIDAERPVIYRGDKSDLSFEKHFFVVDGYDIDDPDYFWFNFGWGYPGNSYNLSRQYLNDLTPGDYDFNENQEAIVGISPYFEEYDINIYDVPYTSVIDTKTEEAQQNISLPLYGKTLSVENGGELTLIAGNSIILKSGFHSKSGSEFNAIIDLSYANNEMEITVPNWPSAFTPNGDGVNDELCFDNIENTNSWEFEAFFGNTYEPIFQSAGNITENSICVWDGSGAFTGTSQYWCTIRFKNNFGRSLEKSYEVLVVKPQSLTKSTNHNINNLKNSENVILTSNTFVNHDIQVDFYPNPNNGIFYLKSTEFLPDKIIIFNSLGHEIFEESDINSKEFKIVLLNLHQGIYFAKIIVNNELIVRKIIIN